MTQDILSVFFLYGVLSVQKYHGLEIQKIGEKDPGAYVKCIP